MNVLKQAMQFLKIWLLCIGAAVAYGIIHDQVTARVCVEYFTIGHPPVFHTNSPTLLGLGWGVIATWWMGALLGLFVALCARFGTGSKIEVNALIRPIMLLLIVMGVCALCAGSLGYLLAARGEISLHDWEYMLGRQRANRFIADFCAHITSYFVGFFGGLFVCGWVVLKRRRLDSYGASTNPSSS
jgi:hypothetical protein